MSRIDKLAILGVRSFDNQRSETIQFQSPLTLIVGYNGSGKTTIIECLKYATTGLLPPNSKGGAFIHDPKMCGEKEVMAQVKLSFQSTTGARMVCTRSMQLTIKKTTRSVKTLEGQLLVVRNGERAAISSRCADLDTLMPEYLGVSKAILDYVIFCHQDESLWPMSEPSVLKKRFDEIFEALKYTKAIENMKIVTKNQKIELGKLKILLEQYRVDKDRGEKAKRRSDELHEEIEDMRTKVELLSEELATITHQQAELFETAKGFAETLANIRIKKSEAVKLREYIEDLGKDMNHLDETDENLAKTKREYSQRLERYEQHIKGQRQQAIQLTEELERMRRRLNDQLKEHGRLQAESNAFQQDLRQREELVREINIKHDISTLPSQLDSNDIDDFISEISRMARDQNSKLERLKLDNQKKIATAQAKLAELQKQRESHETKRKYAQQEIASSDAKIRGFNRDLSKMSVDDGREAILANELLAKESQLASAKKQFEADNMDARHKEVADRLKDCEERRDAATEELGDVNRHVDIRAQLGILQQNKKVREAALSTLIGAKKHQFDQAISGPWSEDDVENQIQTIFDQCEEDVQTATKKHINLSQSLSQMETKYTIAAESLKRMKQQATEASEKVLSSFYDEQGEPGTDVRKYPEALKALEEERKSINQMEFAIGYVTQATAFAGTKKSCMLCRRGFNPDELTTISHKFRADLENLRQKASADAIMILDQDLEALKATGTSYDTWIRLTDVEIPEKEKEVQDHLQKKEALSRRCELLKKDMREKESRKSDLATLQHAVSEISRYRREINQYDEEISSLSDSMTDFGGVRTVEEIKDSIKQLNEEAKKYKDGLQNIVGRRDKARQEINLLERQISDTRKRLSDIQLELVNRRTIQDRMAECQKAIEGQRGLMKQADADIDALVPQIIVAESDLKEVLQKANEAERLQQREASHIAESDMKLKAIQQRIRHFIDCGGPQQLERCNREIEEHQDQVDKLSSDAVSMQDEINHLEKNAANAGSTARSIDDNLRYRKNVRDLEELEKEITRLESLDVQTKQDQYEKDNRILNNRHTRVSSEKSSLVGQMITKDRQLETLIQDYATDFADAKEKYTETLAKVQTTTSAMNDLTKYSAALDKAVMKYHSLKMQEINHIIEELWKATYRGTDVDTIMIRSESENNKSNRSYNYRVVMVKQDAEMDMRGRCSAGQRVLACIIIRLALAECFGVNCGLIALDEPTTNLDIDNIKSLAKSLHGIIETRRSQSNFQLIVITHDEEFLKEMQCQEYCDHYYRVERNDRQKSRIARQSIADVM